MTQEMSNQMSKKSKNLYTSDKRVYKNEESIHLPPLPEPDSYLFQHEETGRTMFVEANQVEFGFEKANQRWHKISGTYTEKRLRDYATAAIEADRQARFATERAQLEAEWVKLKQMQDAYKQAKGEPVAVNIHCVKLKSRKKMEATIPKERLGWWHDVCPGERMVLRDATDSDVARCIRKTSDTRGPEHFFCELGGTGSLVSKDAIQICQTFKVYAVAPQPQQQPGEPVGNVSKDSAIAHVYINLPEGTPIYTAPQPQQHAGETAPDKTYVQEVPDHCDRIVWRGSYYHLPIAPRPQQIPEYTSAIGIAGEAYLRKFKHAHPLPAQFQWPELWQAMLEAALEPKEKA